MRIALAGGASCLVTGNHIHFPAKRCLGVPVLSPAELVVAWRRPHLDVSDVV